MTKSNKGPETLSTDGGPEGDAPMPALADRARQAFTQALAHPGGALVDPPVRWVGRTVGTGRSVPVSVGGGSSEITVQLLLGLDGPYPGWRGEAQEASRIDYESRCLALAESFAQTTRYRRLLRAEQEAAQHRELAERALSSAEAAKQALLAEAPRDLGAKLVQADGELAVLRPAASSAASGHESVRAQVAKAESELLQALAVASREARNERHRLATAREEHLLAEFLHKNADALAELAKANIARTVIGNEMSPGHLLRRLIEQGGDPDA